MIARSERYTVRCVGKGRLVKMPEIDICCCLPLGGESVSLTRPFLWLSLCQSISQSIGLSSSLSVTQTLTKSIICLLTSVSLTRPLLCLYICQSESQSVGQSVTQSTCLTVFYFLPECLLHKQPFALLPNFFNVFFQIYLYFLCNLIFCCVAVATNK